MIKKSVAVALTLVALIAGPAFAGQHYRVVASNPKNGAEIEVPLGDDLQLKLTAAEDGGYHWDILKKPNAAVIAFEKQQSSVNHCSPKPNCVGGSSTERWLFDSLAVGSTVVKLGYFGPGAKSPSKTRRLHLTVIS